MKHRTFTHTWLTGLLASTLLALSAWVVWDNWGRFLHSADAGTTSSAHDSTDAIERGKYLAHIGGCVACHTAKGGDTLAGGRRIDTPFGAVFSSNLTASKPMVWAIGAKVISPPRSAGGARAMAACCYPCSPTTTPASSPPTMCTPCSHGCKPFPLLSKHNRPTNSLGHWARNL